MHHFGSARFNVVAQNISVDLFQLERQINLKSNKVFGIISRNIDALLIISGAIKLLTIVILPIKVKSREDHKFRIVFVLFNKVIIFNFKSVFTLLSYILLSINTLKYLKVSNGHFKPLSIKSLSTHFLLLLMWKA